MNGTYIAHLGLTYAHQIMSGKAEGLNHLNELHKCGNNTGIKMNLREVWL
jgi:hypothetical protein